MLLHELDLLRHQLCGLLPFAGDQPANDIYFSCVKYRSSSASGDPGRTPVFGTETDFPRPGSTGDG